MCIYVLYICRYVRMYLYMNVDMYICIVHMCMCVITTDDMKLKYLKNLYSSILYINCY